MSHMGVPPLKQILSMTRDAWDRDDTRPAVREAFQKALDCGTAALGAEVFASQREERVVYHTCKSRACPSCGRRATIAWQRDQWRELPDLPYAHVCLTMPDVLWPLFRRNRHLLHDLPVLGAQVLQQWARQKALTAMWQYAIITYLREAARAGILHTDMSLSELKKLLTAQYERWWNIDIKRFRSKGHFLGYAGRYARHPPIAQHRFRAISRQ